MNNQYYGMNRGAMYRNNAVNCSRRTAPSAVSVQTEMSCMPEIPPAVPYDMVPAMAYVPLQFYNTVYEPMEGFRQGTIFPELDKPWLAGGNCCG